MTRRAEPSIWVKEIKIFRVAYIYIYIYTDQLTVGNLIINHTTDTFNYAACQVCKMCFQFSDLQLEKKLLNDGPETCGLFFLLVCNNLEYPSNHLPYHAEHPSNSFGMHKNTLVTHGSSLATLATLKCNQK